MLTVLPHFCLYEHTPYMVPCMVSINQAMLTFSGNVIDSECQQFEMAEKTAAPVCLMKYQ